MQVWRLIKTKYAATPFDGEGARLYGARWNSPGNRVAYASGNSALAVLEVLVHMTGGGSLPGYSLVCACLPDSLVEVIDSADLPDNWDSSPVPPEVQAVGDAWLASTRSLALQVPSALVRDSYNLLINPEHGDFGRLTIISSEPFDFDRRLLR
jgi:RES domain-containing protein